jgi:ArsR family transcriptional regulator
MTTNTATAVKPRVGKPAPKKLLPLKVSDDTIGRLTKVFKLLADESRMRILLALAEQGEMHVSALCDALGGQSQPAVSHHLTLMRLTGLVSFRRDGKNNYYRLEVGHIRDLLERVFSDCANSHRQILFEDLALTLKRGK